MRSGLGMGFASAALVLAASAFAGSPGDDMVTARQSALKAMGKTFKEIHGIVGGDIAAQRATLVADARTLKSQARAPWSNFAQETESTSLKNEALPTIWSNPTGFKADQARLIAAVDALDAIAASGAPAEVTAKADAVGQACGACHKEFKEK